jgi:hypothetical protein
MVCCLTARRSCLIAHTYFIIWRLPGMHVWGCVVSTLETKILTLETIVSEQNFRCVMVSNLLKDPCNNSNVGMLRPSLQQGNFLIRDILDHKLLDNTRIHSHIYPPSPEHRRTSQMMRELPLATSRLTKTLMSNNDELIMHKFIQL